MTTPKAPVTPVLNRIEQITRAKNLWTNVLLAKSPATWWCYSGSEITELRAFLAANNLTAEDIDTTETEIARTWTCRHMKAAEEAWRLAFKNDSAVSVAGRIEQMEINLAAAGRTRLDLGLLESSQDWLTQHPDLEAAMMNAGRLKWVPRMWDHVNGRFQIYEFSTDGTLVVRKVS